MRFRHFPGNPSDLEAPHARRHLRSRQRSIRSLRTSSPRSGPHARLGGGGYVDRCVSGGMDRRQLVTAAEAQLGIGDEERAAQTRKFPRRVRAVMSAAAA